MKGGRGTAKTELERQNVLLKWIDEQLPIIASECQTPTISTHRGLVGSVDGNRITFLGD
jgi:hypothetical protein